MTSGDGDPRLGFNALIHAPLRLQICATLSEVASMRVSILREQLDVSESVLSKHLSRLEASGYAEIRKLSEGGHLWTWVGLTADGREAYQGHIGALRAIAGL
jgi:DNA-binding MarR family transcriptional regulator